LSRGARVPSYATDTDGRTTGSHLLDGRGRETSDFDVQNTNCKIQYWRMLEKRLSYDTVSNGMYQMQRINLAALERLNQHSFRYMERKCADTIGTVLVPWAGHF